MSAIPMPEEDNVGCPTCEGRGVLEDRPGFYLAGPSVGEHECRDCAGKGYVQRWWAEELARIARRRR